MKTKSATSIKLGICAISVLMMGVVGVSGALTVIGEHFADASQSTIQSIISIPCLTVIPATLISGKLMDYMPKKTLSIIGILLFLIGGIVPAFMTQLTPILVLRGVFGLGIGVIQTTSSALIAENFVGAERESVQGITTSAQMLGSAVMVFSGGWLASVAWNVTFYVHTLGIVALILVAVCLPTVKPAKQAAASGRAHKTKLTKSSWNWALVMFLMYISIQVFTVYMSYLLEEKSLGSSAQSGTAVAIACVGGFIMGILFGKLASKTKNLTLSIGLFCMGISYLFIGLAGNMAMVFIGSFLYGVALSICMPVAVVGTANSVDAYSAAMALSITMCAQNLSQFVCPYLLNAIIPLFRNEAITNELAYLLGAALLIVMGIGAISWSLRKTRQEQAAA